MKLARVEGVGARVLGLQVQDMQFWGSKARIKGLNVCGLERFA